MALVLPYPNKPANGDTLDATPVQANITAIAQAIQSFDGSQIQAATVQAAAMATAANPITRGAENLPNYIYSGAVTAAVSGLNITISGGTLYVNGNRLVFVGVGSQTLLASKDYYIDVDNLGNVTYANVANGASAPALTANSVRIAKVITGASTITSVFTTGMDSNGVIVYPKWLTKDSADSNGWIKKSYGNWNRYEQRFTANAVSVPAGNFVTLSNVTVPVGIADYSRLKSWTGAIGGFAGRIFPFTDNGNTLTVGASFNLLIYNISGSGITYNGYVDVFMETF